MSDPALDLEPPSAALTALLGDERAAVPAAGAGDDLAAAQARVLARLGATLGALEAPPPTPPAPAPVPPPVPPAGAPGMLASMFTKGGLSMLALGLLAGTVGTAALLPRAPASVPAPVAAPISPPEATLSVPATPPTPSIAPSVVPNDRGSTPATPPGEGSTGGKRVGASPSARPDDGRDPELERERVLLDVARGALARGNGPLALRSLDDHAARFPSGRLTEDREALRVKALIAAGRNEDAARSRAAFQQRYPDSFALPTTSAVPAKEKTNEKSKELTDPFSHRQ